MERKLKLTCFCNTSADSSEANRSILKGTNVRFADKMALMLAFSVGKLIDRIPEEDLEATGMVTISNFGTIDTIKRLYTDSKDKMVSPLKFPAANPGSIAGLSCIKYKLRGNTMNLTQEVNETSIKISKVLADGWLRSGQSKFIILSTIHKLGDQFEARCSLLKTAETDIEINEAEIDSFLLAKS